jgi:hypothetical protein
VANAKEGKHCQESGGFGFGLALIEEEKAKKKAPFQASPSPRRNTHIYIRPDEMAR